MIRWLCTAATITGAVIAAAPAAAQSVRGSASPALSQDEVTWHVRAGLNVAALACRDGDAATTVARYNRMLDDKRVPLAAARAGVEAGYRARFGAMWRARDDDDMTRLYNHFATPEARDAFCAAARALLDDSETVKPGEFHAFARYALPRLEQAVASPPGPVAQPRYALAASDAAPRIAYATNARVPLAPDGREATYVAPAAVPAAGPDDRPAARPVAEAQPGFRDEP